VRLTFVLAFLQPYRDIGAVPEVLARAIRASAVATVHVRGVEADLGGVPALFLANLGDGGGNGFVPLAREFGKFFVGRSMLQHLVCLSVCVLEPDKHDSFFGLSIVVSRLSVSVLSLCLVCVNFSSGFDKFRSHSPVRDILPW
jgi:hypothetical protein